MEANDGGRRDIGKSKQGFADRLTHVPIDRYRCESLTALSETGLMVFSDVDSGFAEERPYTANHARNIVIREDQKCIPRLDIDVKRADSCESRK